MTDEVMPLNKAMYILADIYTRDDEQFGFVVQSGGSYRFERWTQGEYIEAWKSVRHNCGMPVATEYERTLSAQQHEPSTDTKQNETGTIAPAATNLGER